MIRLPCSRHVASGNGHIGNCDDCRAAALFCAERLLENLAREARNYIKGPTMPVCARAECEECDFLYALEQAESLTKGKR